MAERRPLVRKDGLLQEVPSGDTIPEAILPAGTGPIQFTLACSEDLAANDFVNIWDDAGTAKVRKADADASKPAHGFVKAGFTNGQTATVYQNGIITGLSGLTPGARQYLSATAGAITATAPTGAGVISQCVGRAITASTLLVELEDHVLLV